VRTKGGPSDKTMRTTKKSKEFIRVRMAWKWDHKHKKSRPSNRRMVTTIIGVYKR
jgi:hypothetical protein